MYICMFVCVYVCMYVCMCNVHITSCKGLPQYLHAFMHDVYVCMYMCM